MVRDVRCRSYIHSALGFKIHTLLFVCTRSVFFQRWYEQQSVATKRTFKQLLATGQWEFVGGGWVQNDEANPSLYGIVNQMTAGHEYLWQNFGMLPLCLVFACASLEFDPIPLLQVCNRASHGSWTRSDTLRSRLPCSR